MINTSLCDSLGIAFGIGATAVGICGPALIVAVSHFKMRDCADASLQEPKPVWWQKEVALAEGRKKAREIGETKCAMYR